MEKNMEENFEKILQRQQELEYLKKTKYRFQKTASAAFPEAWQRLLQTDFKPVFQNSHDH